MSNCLCDVVHLLSWSPKSGSVPGSATRKYLRIRKSSGKCILQHVPDLQLPLGSGTLPPGTQITKLPQGTGFSEGHLFQTKMDQKDPPNLVFALDKTFSGVGAELDIHSGRGGFPATPFLGTPRVSPLLCFCLLLWHVHGTSTPRWAG